MKRPLQPLLMQVCTPRHILARQIYDAAATGISPEEVKHLIACAGYNADVLPGLLAEMDADGLLLYEDDDGTLHQLEAE